MKLAPYALDNGETGYWFSCPGCGHDHRIPKGKVWVFTNPDSEKPSVAPSMQYQFEEHGEKKVCHCFIHRGKIFYLPDSTHALKRRIAAMEELEIKIAGAVVKSHEEDGIRVIDGVDLRSVSVVRK